MMFKALAFAGVIALACGAAHEAAATLPNIRTSNNEFVSYAGKFEFKRDKKYTVDEDDLEDANDALAADLAALDIDAIEAEANKILEFVDDASTADVAAASKRIKENADKVSEGLNDWTAKHKKNAEQGMAAVDALNADEFQQSLHKEMDDLRKELMKSIADGKDDAIKKSKDAETVAAETMQAGDKLASELAKYEVCSGQAKMYAPGVKGADADGCVFSKSPSAGFKTKVYHRMFNNADGRDSGYVTNRYIQFKKERDETYMRVFWYDNMRVHGHTSHANWNVMICDANGNGCAHCREPGRINMNRYSSHQHNWWMDDRVGQGVMGMCKASDNRQLKKGTYQLKIMIDNNRYDIYTGLNQGNSFMVDEVIKA